MEELKGMCLKKIPSDVYGYLLKLQADKKIKCNCQYSLEQIVYGLVRTAGKKLNDTHNPRP